MLTNKYRQPKIDKFTYIILATFGMLAVIVVFTFQAVFSSFTLSYEVTPQDTQSELKVDKIKVNEAYDSVYAKQKKQLFIQEWWYI